MTSILSNLLFKRWNWCLFIYCWFQFKFILVKRFEIGHTSIWNEPFKWVKYVAFCFDNNFPTFLVSFIVSNVFVLRNRTKTLWIIKTGLCFEIIQNDIRIFQVWFQFIRNENNNIWLNFNLFSVFYSRGTWNKSCLPSSNSISFNHRFYGTP